MQRNPSSRRPPVQRAQQPQQRTIVQQPRKKKLGTKQIKRGALPR